MEDNTALMKEWLPPSPTSNTFFTSFPEANDPITSSPVSQIETNDMKQCEVNRRGGGGGGLGDRIAARAAGFNAPRLNTECIIRTSEQSLNEMKSPYITIPPGISPTALLESPVFLSNSLVSLYT